MSSPQKQTSGIDIVASQWLNSDLPISIDNLRGQVVVIVAFQMLCPGCVSHCLPQASKIHQLYGGQGVQVIGLHSVFEHHEAMSAVSLQAFLHEYQIQFPVAIDQASKTGPIPLTMANLHLQGTPTTIVIDAEGVVRLKHFGQVPDLVLGEMLGQLRQPISPPKAAISAQEQTATAGQCDDGVCSL
ncbi:MAG TPA: alkyl hydroperoxide reductase [Oceanospirillaceae bacterium]|nr:alkyl hydroperoxide reductase [Oceanospirillaceae bacterium]